MRDFLSTILLSQKHIFIACFVCVYVWVPFKTYSSKLGNWKSLYFFSFFVGWVQTYIFYKTTFVYSYLLFKFITNTRFSSTVYSKGVQIKFLSGNQIKFWLRRVFLHAQTHNVSAEPKMFIFFSDKIRTKFTDFSKLYKKKHQHTLLFIINIEWEIRLKIEYIKGRICSLFCI